MKYGCPNQECKFHLKKDHIVKDGSYLRKSDSRVIKRFRCGHCEKRFSSATFSMEFRQKKRRVNKLLCGLLSSGVSMRRAAKLLNIHRITVRRKLDYLAKKAQLNHASFLLELRQSPLARVQFDDLITIEHTKLKPLSVSIAIDPNKRKILGAKVSQIPAFGNLAHLSRQKYGYRKSHHKEGLQELFEQIKKCIEPEALFESDEHKFYPEFVEKYFPASRHKRYKGGRGCIAGQGELKKLKYDPLFCLNHTCAMFRANINRLIRKTWCTTKDPEMLQKHIDIYINYHNTVLTM